MKKEDSKTEDLQVKKEISRKLFERIFLPWTVILILFHLLTIYVAPAYMWGVHFYHFFPAWIGWLLTLIMLIILVPGISEFLYDRLETVAKKIKKLFAKLGENKTFLLLSLLSIPIFWIFRTKLYLLGDGYFRIQDLPEGKLHLQEWGDGFIHLVIYRGIIKLIPTWTPELTYSIISILCGGLFVFISLKLASLLGKNGFQQVLIFVLLITLGSIELFCGYVESYSILQVVLLAYIWFSALSLSGKTSLIPALLLLVISIGLHIASLVFLPSFIYLLWESQVKGEKDRFSSPPFKNKTAPEVSSKRRKSYLKRESQEPRPKLKVPILIALILSAVLIVFWVHRVATSLEETGKGMFILPLTGTASYPFGMFSLDHISEFINQLLLLSPLGISLIIFFLFLRIRFRDISAGSIGQEKLTNFLILSIIFALIYLFVFNFTLGSADWDLRSSPAPFVGLLGVLIFLRWGEEWSTVRRPSTSLPSAQFKDGEQSRTVRTSPPSIEDQSQKSGGGKIKFWGMQHTVYAWGVIFICFSLFHTVPWVLLNANQTRSVNRYTLIQENDPHPVDETNYNLFKIARILRLAGLPDEVEKMYRRAQQRYPREILNFFNLAVDYYKADEFDKAIPLIDTILKMDPLYPKANWMMGSIYGKRGKYAKALSYLEEALPYLADNGTYLFDLGRAYFEMNQLDKAETCAQQMIDLDPQLTDSYHLLGMVYAKLGDYETAKREWEKVLTIDPADSTAINNIKEIDKFIKK